METAEENLRITKILYRRHDNNNRSFGRAHRPGSRPKQLSVVIRLSNCLRRTGKSGWC